MKEKTALSLMWFVVLLSCLQTGFILTFHHKQRVQELSQSRVEIEKDSVDSWMFLQLAIAMTESEFDPDAVGASKDYGIYQITPIYVAEVNRLLGSEVYQHSDSFDIQKSVEMFNILQSFKNPNHDIDLAIYYHNKAPWYKKRVLQNYQFVLRYEQLRQVLKDEVFYSNINSARH